jgi:hypothetical protein
LSEKEKKAKQEVDLLGNPLFEMKVIIKKHWFFVCPVAEKGSEITKIKSTDAIKAFCSLCCTFEYSKGNGKIFVST